ncbi:MAG: homoserine dehydrogenase [Chitinispirillaceae bacterium]|jgi:homoserine dehydrogenase|nr:homoserine dehydrogenase [Chitinispirillaceae bacterium]
MQEILIGIVGAGTVGGGVVKILSQRIEHLRKELELPVRLARIVDKDVSRFAQLPVGDAICTSNVNDILNDDAIGIVIELVGGTTFARKLVLAALEKKKHVITANKALLAEYGPEIFAAAQRAEVSVYFEAAVGGGMPIIKTLREGLVANDISSVTTIINGTCNYILSKMTTEGQTFAAVLKKAQAKGYAETDPALDVGGGDTGHKLAILASLISAGYVPYSSIAVEGITGIGSNDIAFAKELGYIIKLLGIIKKDADGRYDVRVHPAMLSVSHILASVSGVYNAVLLEGNAVGQILLYGRGAGEMPTASAIVSDIVDAARNISGETPIRVPMDFYSTEWTVPVKPLDAIVTRYYLRFTVLDKPGVLASISGLLGAEGISLASVMQKEGFPEKGVPLIFITHAASESKIRSVIARVEATGFTKDKTQVIRIED